VNRIARATTAGHSGEERPQSGVPICAGAVLREPAIGDVPPVIQSGDDVRAHDLLARTMLITRHDVGDTT
jgi:hypothetical protein